MRRWQFLLTTAPCLLFVLATNASAASLTLEWNPPNDGATVRYVVLYGTASQSYSSSLEVGAVTTARIEGLAAGTGYCFAVQAFNGAGQPSAPSAEVCGTTEAAYVEPPPPPPPPP